MAPLRTARRVQRRILLPVCAAAVALAALLPLRVWADPAAPRPAAIREWVLHFEAATSDISASAYTSLLRQLPPSSRVLVAVPKRRDSQAFREQVDLPGECWDRVEFLVMGQALSAWPRDRYVFFERRGRPTLLLPDEGSVSEARRGDLAVGLALAAEEPAHEVVRTRLAFEGGDLIVGKRVALVGAGTVAVNCRRLCLGTEAVRAELAAVLGRRVLIVGAELLNLPHEHIDMYVHLLDDRTVLVGDPRAAVAAWDGLQADLDQRERLAFFGNPTHEDQACKVPVYEAIAEDLKAQGFRVERVPALHAQDGDVVLTWTNAVVEDRAGELYAYVPTYGLRVLDAEAHAVWKRLGCRVVPVDVAAAVLEGGALRCLTNVLRRPSGPDAPPAVPLGQPATPRAGRPGTPLAGEAHPIPR